MVEQAEVMLSVGTAVLGAACGWLFQRLSPGRDASRVVHIHGDNAGTIEQNVHNNHTHVTNSWYTEARERRQPRSGSSGGRPAADSSQDEWAPIAIGALIMAGVVAMYLRYHVEVIRILTFSAYFGIAFVFVAAAGAKFKGLVLTPGLAVQALVNALLSLFVLYVVRLAVAPPFYEGDGRYSELIARGRAEGLNVFSREFGSDSFLFLLYQVAGLLALAMLLTFVIFHAVKVLAIGNFAFSGNRSRVWAWLATAYGPPGLVLGVAVVLAAASFGMVSGAIYSSLPSSFPIPAMTGESVPPTSSPLPTAP